MILVDQNFDHPTLTPLQISGHAPVYYIMSYHGLDFTHKTYKCILNIT